MASSSPYAPRSPTLSLRSRVLAGIDLSAASECIFAELPPDAAWLAQAEDRLHRKGQRSAVTATVLLAHPSIAAGVEAIDAIAEDDVADVEAAGSGVAGSGVAAEAVTASAAAEAPKRRRKRTKSSAALEAGSQATACSAAAASPGPSTTASLVDGAAGAPPPAQPALRVSAAEASRRQELLACRFDRRHSQALKNSERAVRRVTDGPGAAASAASSTALAPTSRLAEAAGEAAGEGCAKTAEEPRVAGEELADKPPADAPMADAADAADAVSGRLQLQDGTRRSARLREPCTTLREPSKGAPGLREAPQLANPRESMPPPPRRPAPAAPAAPAASAASEPLPMRFAWGTPLSSMRFECSAVTGRVHVYALPSDTAAAAGGGDVWWRQHTSFSADELLDGRPVERRFERAETLLEASAVAEWPGELCETGEPGVVLGEPSVLAARFLEEWRALGALQRRKLRGRPLPLPVLATPLLQPHSPPRPLPHPSLPFHPSSPAAATTPPSSGRRRSSRSGSVSPYFSPPPASEAAGGDTAGGDAAGGDAAGGGAASQHYSEPLLAPGSVPGSPHRSTDRSPPCSSGGSERPPPRSTRRERPRLEHEEGAPDDATWGVAHTIGRGGRVTMPLALSADGRVLCLGCYAPLLCPPPWRHEAAAEGTAEDAIASPTKVARPSPRASPRPTPRLSPSKSATTTSALPASVMASIPTASVPTASPRSDAELFCGGGCRSTYFGRRRAASLRRQLAALDGAICALCGLDAAALCASLVEAPPGQARAVLLGQLAPNIAAERALAARLLEAPHHAGHAWHADHRVAVRDGGGECTVDNMQVLCVACHVGKTRAEATAAAAARRAAHAHAEPVEGP